MTMDRLFNVSHPLAKNILRGVASSLDNHFDIEKALIKIKKKTNEHNAKQALTILRTSQVYNKNVLTRHFNQKVPKKLVDIAEYSVEEVTQLIDINKKEIFNCLSIVLQIYQNIRTKEFTEAIDNFVELIECRGVSLVLYRLMMYLKTRLEYMPEHSDYITLIDDILVKIQIGNLRSIDDGLRQIISDRADYFSICSKIKNANINDYSKRILLSFISHAPRDKEDFVKNLNAHLSYSLIDAALYLNLTNRMEFLAENHALPTSIQSILDEIASIDVNLSYYDEDLQQGLDLSFYREAYLLIEQNDCLKYKTVHAQYFNLPDNTLRIKTPYESRVINDYFGDLKGISDLRCNGTDNYSINLSKFDVMSCSFLENTSAFDYLLNKLDGNLINSTDDELVFIKLMSKTRDIAYLCLPEYLTTIKNKTTNLEVKLIVLCLLTAASLGDDDSDFELRKVFQNLCLKNHDGDILETLKSFYKISPSITDYFLTSFDEVFISRLFNIDVRPNEALGIRADLFDWFGEKTGDKKYNARAKNTRVDIQINKHRQHIDDSRIYAEPARVKQWITDNINNQLALQFDNFDNLGKPRLQLDWYKLTTSLNPENSIGIAIAESYNEFVNNKFYGISSYLGRRVRHGTATGNGIAEVKALIQHSKYESLSLDPYFSEQWDKWLKTYISSFNELTAEYFHIKSDEKKKGLFSPLIDNSNKCIIADSLVNALYKSYLEIDNVAVAPVLISEYCWLLIDGELAAARKHISKTKSRVSVFNIKEQSRLMNKRLVQKFSEEVNSLTDEKFTIVCSWFNKPSYATQSADISLLFKVVVEEIKSQNPGFSPKVQDENTRHKLTGGLYFVIYDALTVIIKNIAEHGDPAGTITLEYRVVQPTNKNEMKTLLIKISSQSLSSIHFVASKKRIVEKLASNNIGDANVIEGDSGIKKLKSMELDKLIHNLDFKFRDDSRIPLITAIFAIELDY